MESKIKKYASLAVVIIGVIATALGVAILARDVWMDLKKPKVLTQEESKNPITISKEMKVSEPAAREIVKEIERTSNEQPQISYYVSSPSVERGAKKVAEQIKSQSPEAPRGVLEKSDRTIVTADKNLQKVDVYKISLRKAHKIKTGMTYVDNHAYLSAGYQAGRWEGLAHFNNEGFKGMTVMYTLKEW